MSMEILNKEESHYYDDAVYIELRSDTGKKMNGHIKIEEYEKLKEILE